MNPIFRALALLSLSVLGACAVTPYKALDVKTVRTVGWYGEIDPVLNNVHTGITIFGNFSTPLAHDWQLQAHLEQALSSRLEAAGYQFKRLELAAEEQKLLADGGCFSDWDGHYKIELCGQPIADLLKRHQIDLLIWSKGFTAHDYFTQGPAQLPQIGVFTRGTDRPNLMVPYAHVSMAMMAGDPAEPRKSAGCMRGRSRDPSPWPKKVGDMSIEDYAFLRPEFEMLLDRSAHRALVESGLLPGPIPTCPDQQPGMEKL